MGGVVIRGLSTTDVPGSVEAVERIAVAAWEPIFAYYRQAMGDDLFEAACPNWRERKAKQVRTACDPSSPATVCIATHSGRIVGFITFYADERSGIGEIGNNAVDPVFQGQGIGPAMYEHAFGQLRERGMRYVRVRTGGDPAHAPAQRAYEKAGFDIQLPGVEYYRRL